MMNDPYARLGVRRRINAAGALTRLGGAVMAPEVVEAMAAASRASVDIGELQDAASARIAEATGAEAGLVTTGAAAALTLAAAAAIARWDVAKMAALPHADAFPRDILIARTHRTGYAHALAASGARLIDIGHNDRGTGAGVRGLEAWEIEAALSPSVVAMAFSANATSLADLPTAIAACRAAGIPLIVDAAAQLPPKENLKRFIAMGADLVAFSGGKAINGPQATGILCGRRDLVMAAALQHLDLDIAWEQWAPPPRLIDKGRLKGLPQHGIGRTAKVGKEQIVGLLTALELFVAEGDATRHRHWRTLAEALAAGLDGLPCTTLAVTGTGNVEDVPTVLLTLAGGAPVSALELVIALQDGTPPVAADPTRCDDGIVTFSPVCLQPGEPELIAAAVRQALARGAYS